MCNVGFCRWHDILHTTSCSLQFLQGSDMTQPIILYGLSRRRFKRVWFMIVQTYVQLPEHRNAFLMGAGLETLYYLVNGNWKSWNNEDRATISEIKAAFKVAEITGLCEVIRQPNKCTIRKPLFLRFSLLVDRSGINVLPLCPVKLEN